MKNLNGLSSRQRSVLLFIISFLLLLMCCWSAVHLSSLSMTLYNDNKHQLVHSFVIAFEMLGLLSGVAVLLTGIGAIFDNLGDALQLVQFLVIIVTALVVSESYIACHLDLLML
ncbi:hypothetical protein [Photobacterium leiognathi]|uniref:hypothetical protein n=1 Tax=Photobacterium leiognathi TaxID=553611 RepID=UPI00298232A6|nr:hypothetical protein [Photobacterium leiognathi]